MKQLIVTADDFGMARPINEAIETAHREGILTAASLMVSGEAAEDAVERARRLPRLRVGLHLVLVNGMPLLPASAIPDLVDGQGAFSTRLVRSGFRFFFRPRARGQLEAEIRAQFEAFRATGHQLDHVNAHSHMHLHPTVLGLILKVGKSYGLRALRLPYEPPLRSWSATGTAPVTRLATSLALKPWMTLLRYRLLRARIKANDYVFGLYDTGAMEERLVLRFMEELPAGVTEMYFHPARPEYRSMPTAAPGYKYEHELAALVSGAVRDVIRRRGIRLIGFADL